VNATPTLDRRTKRRADVGIVSVEELLGDRGAASIAAHGALAAETQRFLDLPPLTIDVDGTAVTFDAGTISPGTVRGALTATLTGDELTALVAGVAGMSSRVTRLMPPGPGPGRQYVLWDFVLRALFDGRALHDPKATPAELGDLGRAFPPDADDRAIAAALADQGVVHLRGWIDPALLPVIEDEVLAAAAATSRDQPENLWTELADGTERCVRVRSLHRHSPTMAMLLGSASYERLGGLFADGHRLLPLDAPTRSEALIKPVGHVADVTDLPWHRDCGGGSHAFGCAPYVVGLPLSATNEETGVLQVAAGSHLANVPPPGLVDGVEWGLPIVSLPTEPGDLTIHLGCALHTTTTSTTVERTVAYSTFGLPPL
jgi:hypothetical protein